MAGVSDKRKPCGNISGEVVQGRTGDSVSNAFESHPAWIWKLSLTAGATTTPENVQRQQLYHLPKNRGLLVCLVLLVSDI